MKLNDSFLERAYQGPRSAASSLCLDVQHSHLPDEVRQAASLGWHIYPVIPLAKLTGNPDLLIAEATCEVSRLEQLATTHNPCGWRIAVGPSSLCIVRLDGAEARGSFQALTQDCEECLTLWAQRGGTAWAYFRCPEGMVLRASGRKLAAGVSILGQADSCPIPPSDGCAWVNPGAEPEALPYALREVAFETPEGPNRKAAPVPASFARQSPCPPWLEKRQEGAQKGHPIRGHVGNCGGFRISRRR